MAEFMARARASGSLRVLAALLGTLPMTVFGAACLARYLPLELGARFTVGFTLALPLWVAAMCVVFLTRNAARACAVCVGAAVLLAALAYRAPTTEVTSIRR